MSLINEALKKAQQDRARQASLVKPSGPLDSGTAGVRPLAAPISPPLPLFRIIIGLVIGGSALASAVAFMIFLFLQIRIPAQPAGELQRQESTPVSIQTLASPDPTPSSGPQLALDDLPSLPATRVPATLPEVAEPPAPLQAPEPEPVAKNRPAPTSPVDPRPDPSPSIAETRPPAPDPGLVGSPKDPTLQLRENNPDSQPLASGPPPGHEERLNQYLRQMSVSGIRLSGPDSKVVLNNRVYRLTETVLDTDLNLIIVGIEPTLIHFQDEYGQRHTKRY